MCAFVLQDGEVDAEKMQRYLMQSGVRNLL